AAGPPVEAAREETFFDSVEVRVVNVEVFVTGRDGKRITGLTRDDFEGRELVPLTVKLPLSKLVLLPQGAFHEGRVTIQLAVRDPKGSHSGINEVQVPVRIPNEQLLTALSQHAGYRTKVSLRPSSHVIAVSVRDELGNAESTVLTPYEPPQGAEVLAANRAGR
ncbi:MAG TPA: hypothetical protein VEL74_00450, partial [Thermoanaerobaculia bacterium]|nr:hypothetical protein [Thermoanaerobaculia bacterium]